MNELVNTSDESLLARFAQTQTPEALQELIRRYGRLVLNACRRILRSRAEAEEAAQAVFLTLARKTPSVSDKRPLAGWLYDVACGIAQNARRALLSRRASAGMAADESARISEWARVEPLLDEELSALPPKHRLPIVLFHLQGCSQRDSCRMLGCGPIALEERLTASRELLRKRLESRDVLPSAGLLAMLLSSNSRTIELPPEFPEQTATLATTRITDRRSSQVLTLSDGAVKMMFIAKLKTAALVFITLAILGTGVGLTTYRALAGDRQETRAGDPPQAARN